MLTRVHTDILNRIFKDKPPIKITDELLAIIANDLVILMITDCPDHKFIINIQEAEKLRDFLNELLKQE